jgi:hypothetical protein
LPSNPLALIPSAPGASLAIDERIWTEDEETELAAVGAASLPGGVDGALADDAEWLSPWDLL